jgi:hypothetical protein
MVPKLWVGARTASASVRRFNLKRFGPAIFHFEMLTGAARASISENPAVSADIAAGDQRHAIRNGRAGYWSDMVEAEHGWEPTEGARGFGWLSRFAHFLVAVPATLRLSRFRA